MDVLICEITVMYYVYILKSEARGRYSIGYSNSPERRLLEHNPGKVKSTKSFRPWIKVYQEVYKTETSAINREKEIKLKKSRGYIEWLIKVDTSR